MVFSMLLSNKILNIFRSFIVQTMEFGAVTSDSEILIDFVVRFEKLGSMARLDGVGLDEVGVDNVEKNNVVVAFVGCDGESAGLIGEQLSLGFGDCHEYHVGFVVLWSLLGFFHGVDGIGRGAGT